ncbi:MAG: hypothetical protein ABI262_24940 [Microcoleus sp.]|jgi:hypothetical protein
MFYVLINDKGISVHSANEMLTLREMQNLVGIEGEPAYIEVASYRSYSDNSIVMICDDEFLRKSYNPTCYTAEGDIIHGQLLILGTDAAYEDFGLLTLKQTEIIKRETKLYQRK